MLKSFFLGVVLSYLVIWFGYPFYQPLFPGGGVAETHLKPIYMGLVLISGLIFSSTYAISKTLEELKHEISKKDDV